jgi:hypothetical protein
MLKTPFKWTDQNVEILREMLLHGNSSAEVSRRVGCSRNAAIGKALRLGYSFGSGGALAKRDPSEAKSTAGFSEWTEEQLLKASALWKLGKTAAQIAMIVGRSAASVNSKSQDRRDLFPFRERTTHQAGAASNNAKHANSIRRAQGFPPLPKEYHSFDSSMFAIDGQKPVQFVDLAAGQCKFPISSEDSPSGADMPCCGAKADFGSYCSHHATISRGRGTRGEQGALDGIGGRKL